MIFNVTSAKLTGNPGTSGWAQVHEFYPQEKEKVDSRGHFFAVIATKAAGEGIDSVSRGREILARLHEEYFGKGEGSAFNALKAAVQKVVEEFRPSLGTLEIAAGAVLSDVVYSAVSGGAQVSIFRNGMLAKVLVSEEGVAETVCASGYPKEGDTLLLGTKVFFASLPAGVIKAALQGGDPEAAIESLAPPLHSKEESGTIAGVILKFEKEKEGTAVGTDEVERAVPSMATLLKNRLRELVKSFVPERRIYVHYKEEIEATSPKRKLMVSVGAILIVLLVVSIFFGVRQKRIRDQKQRYEGRLNQARHELEEALGLVDLNHERARELFASSRGLVLGLTGEGIKDPDLEELAKKVEENQGRILGEYRPESQVFLDLSLLTSGFSGEDLSSSGEVLFVLDKDGRRVVEAEVSTKKTEVVAGPDVIQNADSLASYEDRVFILNSQGVFEVNESLEKLIDKDWEGQVFAYAYAGNFYVLDKVASAIWRYPAVGESFGSRQRWLGPGVIPNFSEVASLTIDGTIWVLNQNETILKFSLGSPQGFSVSGVTPALTRGTSIYTNENLKYLYVLDTENSRILVLDKTGDYKAQYFSDKIKEAKDLVVSEEEKRAIFLTGDKLYLIELEHF